MKPFRLLLIALTTPVVGLGCEHAPGTMTSPTFRSGRAERMLHQQLEAEKERIFRESERSKAIYDSLKVVWDRVKGDYQVTESGLIYCDPLQYVGQVKIVGPDGADIDIGPHKLRIPRGALQRETVITGEMPVALWVGVRLSPEGQTFIRQPQLTLSYKHCLLPSNHAERVAYTDDSLNIISYPVSRDRQDGLVDAWFWHFSNYAVAW